MYWYVLFIRAGREYNVERLLNKRLDKNMFVPFIPLQEFLFKVSGKIKKEIKPLFPNYVFVESMVSSQEFLNAISLLANASRDIIRILRYSDTEIAIRESERQMLLSLYNSDCCIESSTGILEGDQIRITDGPLEGWESKVKRVDRHKRQAWIEIEFFGETRIINLALDIAVKVK